MKPIIIHLLEAFHQIDSSPYMFTLCIKFEIQSLKNLEHGVLNIMYKVYIQNILSLPKSMLIAHFNIELVVK